MISHGADSKIPSNSSNTTRIRLTRSTARNTLTITATLTTSDVNTTPSPITARSAKDVNLFGIRVHRSSNAIESDISNRDARSGFSSRRSVFVILLDNDAIVRDAGNLVVGVSDILDGTGGVVDGLDAEAVGGVCDGVAGDDDVGDVVVVAAADTADRNAVAAGTSVIGESDAGA